MSNADHLKLVEPPVAPADPLVGAIIDGRYQVERILGQGGMGVVYGAKHVVLGKPLAIKVLKADVSKDQGTIQRFRQEAQSASAIGSQHIIDISDFGTLPDGATYFVMEHLDGQELTKAIENDQPIPPDRVVRIAKQLCDALGAAHERGIVHRDLKPDNVFLIKRGGHSDFVKVLDFGIAKVGGASSKLTQAGQVFGTPHYMSPEQCSGQGVDHRTDIYALGVILYEMCVGRVPFDADNLMGILTKHIYEQPIPPHTLPPPTNVPAGLEAVILKCLAKHADARYQTMAEVRADLEAFERGATPGAVLEAVERQTTPMLDPTGQHAVMQVGVGGELESGGGSKLPLILGGLGALALLMVGGGVALYLTVLAPEPAPEPLPVQRVDARGIDEPEEPAVGAVENTVENVVENEEELRENEGEGQAENEVQAAAPAPIQIVSEPAGVEVWTADGALLGNTPFAAPRPDEGATLTLILKQPGYRDHEVRLGQLTSQEVRVTLARARPGRRGPARPPVGGQAAPQPQPQPQPQPSTQGGGIGGSEVLDPWAR